VDENVDERKKDMGCVAPCMVVIRGYGLDDAAPLMGIFGYCDKEAF